MKALGTFLVTIALIVGLVSCVYPPPFPEQYNLTISSTEGGSVTTPGEGTFTYWDMDVVELVAEADEGYRFVEWTGNVRAVDDVNAANTTITMSDEYSVTANFERILVTSYTLTIAVNGSGSTSPSVGQHTYTAGTVVPIIATPASNYAFISWTGNVGAIGDINATSTNVTMNGGYSITANFAGAIQD